MTQVNGCRYNRTLCRAVAAALLLSLFSAWSQRAAGPDGVPADVTELQSLEVRGRSLDNPVVEPLAPPVSQELTSSDIDREEIRLTRPRLAVEALNFTPSFQLRRNGRKNPVGLTLRGAGNMNVLFDGHYIGTSGDTRFIDFLPADILENVRVIRDSTGLIYGPPQLSGPGGVVGFGGVIDLQLLEPPPGHHGAARAEVGRFSENTQHLHFAGHATDALGYVISADRDVCGGPGGENMEHRYHHILARLIYNYEGDSTLTLNILRTDGERELQKAGPRMVFSGWEEEFSPWETTTLTLGLNHVWTPALSTTVDTYYRDYEATYHRYDLGVEDDLRETKKGVLARQTIAMPERNTLRFGAEYSEWTNPTGKLYYNGMQRREKDYSVYVQDEWEAIPDRLTVDGGVRWDRTYQDKGVIANGPAFVSGRPVSVSNVWTEPAISYSAGMRLQVSRKQLLTARFALSSQAVGSDFVGSGGMRLEDPEETRYELGYRVDFTEAFALTATTFWTTIDNGLVYAGPAMVGGVQRPSWQNADLERTGVELQAEGSISQSIAYFINGTWLNGTSKVAGMDKEHDDRLPQYLAAGGLRYRRGPWVASISLKYTSPFEDSFGTRPRRDVDLGDYWLLQANAGYTIARGETFEHEIYGGIRNALNERYETYPGFKDPGRNVYAGYAVRW